MPTSIQGERETLDVLRAKPGRAPAESEEKESRASWTWGVDPCARSDCGELGGVVLAGHCLRASGWRKSQIGLFGPSVAVGSATGNGEGGGERLSGAICVSC